MYASNREGRSEVARVRASTLKRPAAEKRLRYALDEDRDDRKGKGGEGVTREPVG